MSRRDVERDVEYSSGYADGRATSSANNAGLGIILGILVVGLAGVGGWLVFGQNNQRPADTNIINLPSSAPAAPQAPDVNVTVPAPKIEVPAPKVEAPVPTQNSNSVPAPSGDAAKP